ncbi:MAG: Rieske 2Fe-2S domain-containing protein [Myxococcota bacterium]|jgi:nitrite reductase/ring-hydroxylating ferredoxin subunit|nr:Rieske 2Fe-2S domain-containing protein [Myxococcota bacterium]
MSDDCADGAGLDVPLLRLDELPAGADYEARGVSADLPQRAGLFVLRFENGVRVYRNRCPHLGSPLNWTPDRFLDLERKQIICATHGAVFRIDDGLCVSGPCEGDWLEPVASEVRDGVVYVASDWQDV